MCARADFPDECARGRLDVAARLIVAALPIRVLLIGQIASVPELSRSLQRHTARIISRPDALKIGMAPWCTRRGVVG